VAAVCFYLTRNFSLFFPLAPSVRAIEIFKLIRGAGNGGIFNPEGISRDARQNLYLSQSRKKQLVSSAILQTARWSGELFGETGSPQIAIAKLAREASTETSSPMRT
jgi:hypothetical protein